MTNRRKFIKMLGLGAASAPMAAQHMNAQQLSGINVGVASATSRGIAEAAEDASEASKDEVNVMDRAASYLKSHGKLPDHVEKRMRDSASYIRNLDYDIAIKCWSLSVKIQEQRDRNYQNELRRYREGTSYNAAQRAFEAATGFKWPW